MTKNELADMIVSQTRLTKSQAIQAIDGFISSAKSVLAEGENICLRGFGTFRLERRAAKKARHIGRGMIIDVPAHRVLKFLPCNELKDMVW